MSSIGFWSRGPCSQICFFSPMLCNLVINASKISVEFYRGMKVCTLLYFWWLEGRTSEFSCFVFILVYVSVFAKAFLLFSFLLSSMYQMQSYCILLEMCECIGFYNFTTQCFVKQDNLNLCKFSWFLLNSKKISGPVPMNLRDNKKWLLLLWPINAWRWHTWG